MTLEERVARLEAEYKNLEFAIRQCDEMKMENMKILIDLQERLGRMESLQEQSITNNDEKDINTIIMILATSILSPIMVFLIQEIIRMVH